MAGKKESPRQKMIGMMYLVLTALLALNVSKDILEAFVVVNDGLEVNAASTMLKNAHIYTKLDEAKMVDPEKAMENWTKAKEVQNISEELYAYIGELKAELIAETEDVPMEVADTIGLEYVDKKDNYDVPTHIMIGAVEDGSKGKARELKEKIAAYRELLLNMLGNGDAEKENIGLETNDQEDLDGSRPWEVYNFDHTPLAASVTILTKLQTDVKNAEYYTINKLHQDINGKSIPFDTVAARVMPRSNYVLLGEEYEADVFLAAFSRTAQPEMLIGNMDASQTGFEQVNDTLEVNEGMGRYVTKPNREGIFEWEGAINYTMPDGQVKAFPFKSEYIVAKPSLVVSPTKMNVLYKGIENPIDVSVPGIPSENIFPEITGGNKLKKLSNGKYVAVMSSSSPKDVKVVVKAKLASGETRNVGSMDFRVKQLPAPQIRIGKTPGDQRMKKEILLAHGKILADCGRDFPFDIDYEVTSFQIGRRKGDKWLDPKTNGGKFSQEMRVIIDDARPGERILFQNVTAMGPDKVKHNLGTIVITVF